MSKLSLIIPVYNEERTIAQLLDKVLEVSLPDGFTKEIIVVNDCSKDTSAEIIKKHAQAHPEIIFMENDVNSGKSQTVIKGLKASTGDWTVIQDADLEYVPSEIAGMLKFGLDNNLDVVYGDRFGKNNKVIYLQNWIGNRLLSAFSNIFTFPRIGKFIPDMEVCYKLVKGEIMRDIAQGLVSKTVFGFEPEVTAKLSKYKLRGTYLNWGIYPISYMPRSIAEGKHMKAFQDGFKALLEIIKFNLS
jgi:glycosyltransferase involved in cell wall biosynthesis